MSASVSAEAADATTTVVETLPNRGGRAGGRGLFWADTRRLFYAAVAAGVGVSGT